MKSGVKIHETGDWFGRLRLPEFEIRDGDCVYLIAGRYLQCETHGVIPTLGIAKKPLLCEDLAKEWHQTFSIPALRSKASLMWGNVMPKLGYGKEWSGQRLTGNNESHRFRHTDIGVHMLSGDRYRSFSGCGVDDELVRANDIVYANILMYIAETLQIDDYTAECLYRSHQSVRDGGPEVVADYVKLKVSPGLLAGLLDHDGLNTLSGARLLERAFADYPTRHLGSGEAALYETRAIFSDAPSGALVQPLAAPGDPDWLDVFDKPFLVPDTRSEHQGEMCFACISHGGKITCQGSTHRRHQFSSDTVPPAIRVAVWDALKQRLGITESSSRPLAVGVISDVLQHPSVWSKMDQILDYAGIATTGNVLSYIRDGVSPEVAQRWLGVGIADSREIRWAELLAPHLEGQPVGYIGAMAKALSKGRASTLGVATRDRVYDELSADEEKLRRVIDDITHNRDSDIYTGIYSVDWTPTTEWRHIPTLEAMKWKWLEKEIESEAVDSPQQLGLSF